MQAIYVSSNQFKVSEDKTEEFLAGRRIRILCGSEYKYSTIYSSVYSSPYTIVTIEETVLTSNLTEVYYGIVNIGEQGSFPNHSHSGDEGTGGELSLLTLSDTPAAYENGEYLRSTTSGVEWTIPEAEATVIKVKEENTSVITKGQVCAITGSSGVKVKVGLCDCDDSNKIRIIGLAQSNIPQDGDGVVAYKGIITNVDTRTTNSNINPNGEIWTSEDLLWVSNTPGGLTKNRPTSGRSIKAARTVKGNSATDTLIVISHENTIWATASAGENVVLRVGDSAGARKVSIREYTNNEVAAFDSYGNLTVSGTVDGVDIEGFKSEFDNKIEWHLTEGEPGAGVGRKDDIAINHSVGTIYKKEPEYINDSGTFYPSTSTGGGYWYDAAHFSINTTAYIGRFSTYQMKSWVRFTEVIIPTGVTIVSAFIKFRSRSTESATSVNTNIFFNDTDDAVSPTTFEEAESLALTGSVDWNNIGAWVNNSYYNTSDISSILQTVMDRSGWTSGNAIQVVIKDDYSTNNAYRTATTYESVGYAAELHVEWYLTEGTPIWTEKLSPDFLKLSDTPTTYSDSADKYLKTTTSGIEFSDDEVYTKSEVDTISGTLQTNIDTKSDTELFLTEGAPSDVIGVENDIAINQEVGTVYKRASTEGADSGVFYPAVSGDDGYASSTAVSFSSGGTGMYMGKIGDYSHSIWVRFPSVNIPQGMFISEAYVKFTCNSTAAGTTCNLNCHFNDIDNAVAPLNLTQFNNLDLTSAVGWDNVVSWTVDLQYDSPSLVSNLQTIIDRPGWSSGNAVQLVINDNSSSSGVFRNSATINKSAGAVKPELHISWSATENIWEEKLSPDFLKLSDTPTTYADSADKYLKTTNSGIEFSDDLYTKSEVDTISGTLSSEIDSDISTHTSNADAHHNESHTIVSHSDTTATGANLNELVGAGNTTLHKHDGQYYTETEIDTISGTLQTNIDSMPTTLLELADTPTTYSGASGKYVKTTYSGIEFSDDYHFGDATNYTQIETDGKVHFFGSAQPVNFIIMDSLNCDASHLAPLGLISLAAADGILTSGLDTATGSSRRIEVVGIDGGIYVKGRDKGSYTQGDTTHESYRVKVKLNTTNAVWEQTGEWRIILDILSGDITGSFTVHMPAFSIMEYSILELYITVDGATYAEVTPRGFDVSVAGPVAAEELFSNNETTGSGIVVEVASTTGFYVGNEVFVSDSSNSEWTRIEEIVTDTSLTVDLANSYTTVSGAKFNKFDYVKTTLTEPIQRGLFRTKIFKASENSGVQLQMPVPQQTDPTKDMAVVIQYLSTVDNPGLTMVSKWRVQYFFKTIGEDIPESYQYADLVYADVTPPATKCNYVSTLATVTPEDHQGKNLLAMEVVRLGTDSGDTYTGNFKLAAIITNMPWKQLGYEA